MAAYFHREMVNGVVYYNGFAGFGNYNLNVVEPLSTDWLTLNGTYPCKYDGAGLYNSDVVRYSPICDPSIVFTEFILKGETSDGKLVWAATNSLYSNSFGQSGSLLSHGSFKATSKSLSIACRLVDGALIDTTRYKISSLNCSESTVEVKNFGNCMDDNSFRLTINGQFETFDCSDAVWNGTMNIVATATFPILFNVEREVKIIFKSGSTPTVLVESVNSLSFYNIKIEYK